MGFPLNRYKLSAGEQKATEFRTSHVDRTNFTVCRVDDNDRFGRDHYVHYGQLIRLGRSDLISSQRKTLEVGKVMHPKGIQLTILKSAAFLEP